MKKLLIKSALVGGKERDLLIDGDRIEKIAANISADGCEVVDAKGLTALPAFVDMHVHLREPGFEYKEDIESGSKAAVAGGFSAVCCMPNTKPVTDNKYIVRYIKDRAKEVDLVKVYPIAAVSVGEKGETITEMGKLKEAGAVAFSDDGRPVESAQLMRIALEYAGGLNMPVISHCEDLSLVNEGVMNEGYISTLTGLKGITRASEEVMVARDIVLAEALGARVHIAHISTKGSAQLIREAKARGVKVTCETCPHYFAATDELCKDNDANAKVNPPLREESDRLAMIEAIKDGTVDAIVTDHAPHAKHEKDGGFIGAANGISGIETSFALSYTTLVRTGEITLEKLSQLMTSSPASIVGIECGALEEGAKADVTLVDLNEKYRIDKEKFFSKGKNTPFHGREVYGKVRYTVVDGKVKYKAV